jgi:hypothetical protein
MSNKNWSASIRLNTTVGEITRLHSEIYSNLEASLERAMRIGELLTGQKENIGHGGFTAWVKDNLPFTIRTAQNYMRLWNERERIKSETVWLLGSYRLLRSGNRDPKQLANTPKVFLVSENNLRKIAEEDFRGVGVCSWWKISSKSGRGHIASCYVEMRNG